MLLKRLFDTTEPKAPKLKGVRVLRAGPRQNFSPELIQKGSAEGWLSLAKGRLVIEAEGGPIAYAVKCGPGYYCCHCGKPMDNGAGARAHLAAEHPGAKSPDANNPSGYCRLNHYACEREVTHG